MILRIGLQNYLSFGEPMQTARLRPITVLVGANNSGKTNFLRLVDFMRAGAVALEGGFHRPLKKKNSQLKIEWETEMPPTRDPPAGTYRLVMEKKRPGRTGLTETIKLGGETLFEHAGHLGESAGLKVHRQNLDSRMTGVWAGLLSRTFPSAAGIDDVDAIVGPLFNARHVHLLVSAMRADVQLSMDASIASDGSNLAGLIARWILERPDKLEEFNGLIARCLPEMRRVHARCFEPGRVRLEFEQRDSERFDASQVSDGVLIFAGLIAHAMEAPAGALVLMEEPERGIHPRRLVELVDLMRTLVEQRQVQFILATHSPALVNQFRDEPEAILAFSRTRDGTVIRPVSEINGLAETFSRSDPGELLANGFFTEAEAPEKPNEPQ